MIRHLVLGALIVANTSCASQDGTGKYVTKSIGYVDRSVVAQVVGVERLSLRDATTGGAWVGAAVGGLAASGSDDPGIILIGALAGAVAGQLLEDPMNTHPAVLYTVTTQNGASLQVAKMVSDGPIFAEGQRVRVIYGHPARLELMD